MVLCREWSLIKRKGDRATVEPLKCRCWHCEYCAPLRQRQLRAIARSGNPTTFLTLTVNPAQGDGPHDRARRLAHAFRLLIKRAKRKYRLKSIPFLAVFERTKAGEPHLHVLLRVRWLHQRWVSEVMGELIGAPVVDIRRVQGAKRVAAYVSKYIGKDPAPFEGTKRYWRSRDYVQEGRIGGAKSSQDGWEVYVERVHFTSIIKCWVEQGYVFAGEKNRVWRFERAPPEEQGYLWLTRHIRQSELGS